MKVKYECPMIWKGSRIYSEDQKRLLEEQRRSGSLGEAQKEWQLEQDKLYRD